MRKKNIFTGVILFLAAAAIAAESFTVFADGLKGPENLAGDGKGSLYVSDTDHLWRLDATGQKEMLYTRDPKKDSISLGGVSLGPEGKIYFSVGNGILIYNPADQSVAELLRHPGNGFFNGNCFDDAGNLYIADSNEKKVYWVRAGTKELKVFKDDAGWVNGMLWRRDDNTLYFTISSPGRVGGYRLNPDLTIKEEITVAAFPLAGLDDFMLDQDGNFYVCLWLPGEIMKVMKDGKKEVFLEKLDGPSALEFGTGADANQLFILLKGGSTKFNGTQIIKVKTEAKGYKLPFEP